MRVTNNMIVGNTKTNINGNKILVDKYNTQMTTQKKISKASEDPVIAIRSLRLSTSLAHIDQYVDNNIPDAESWLDVTGTALENMKKILTDVRTQSVKGSTDTLTADDRNTILKNLNALVNQVYTEANADYAGRTVFTGFRTESKFTFMEDSPNTKYTITQEFTYEDMEEHRYYVGDVDVPASGTVLSGNCTTEIAQTTYQRIRLAYKDVTAAGMSISLGTAAQLAPGSATPVTPVHPTAYATGTPISAMPTSTVTIGTKPAITSHIVSFANETEWENSTTPPSKVVGDDDIYIIESTGEMILGKNISIAMADEKAQASVTYEKTGFEASDARPEYFYNCTDTTSTNPANHISYKVENQEINYTVAVATELTVNTQGREVLDTSIKRDIEEMISVVQKAIAANEKVDRVKALMKEEQYADPANQKILQSYLDAAQKEADYADDNLQKVYGQQITNFDNYLGSVNLAITNVGSKESRLALTKNRVENQQTTFEELKSNNEDRDISDIIIDYTASYNAYQASLTAASKINQQTLLNYI